MDSINQITVETAAHAPQDDSADYKRMFEQAISTLAAIDAALGIGEDGCGEPDLTLAAIEELKNRAGIAAAPAQEKDSKGNAVRRVITLNGKQLAWLLEAAWPDRHDTDQAETELTIIEYAEPFKSSEGDDMEAGLYFFDSEYPEEGITPVDCPAAADTVASLIKADAPAHSDKHAGRALQFANHIINGAWEGDWDGGAVQDLAVQYGLLKPTEMAEPCSGGCGCREHGADFPTTCYRKTYLAALAAEKGEKP